MGHRLLLTTRSLSDVQTTDSARRKAIVSRRLSRSYL